MTVVYYVLGVLLFAVGVAGSIALHELGHLIPGKLFNVKVSQYFIGFGRTIWSTRRGETEYGVKAIPLGGYVKLVGMLPPDDSEEAQAGGGQGAQVRTGSTGMFGQLVSDARAAEYEEVDPADHDRLFYRLAWWKRSIVWACGVSINLVLAFFLFAITFMGYGTPEPSSTVAKVYECVKLSEAGQSGGKCAADDPASPAAAMGLRPGDTIVSFNGKRYSDYDDFQAGIRANAGGSATVVVERDGKRMTLHGDTTVTLLPSTSKPGKEVKAGFLGIYPLETRQRHGVGYVVDTMGSGTWKTLQAIGSLPQRTYHVARASLGLEKRAADSPMSVVGGGRIAGELVSSDQGSVGEKLFSVVLLLAGLNLFLGLVNLVPLPPFDGAGFATSLVDGVRRGFARVFRRPTPKTLDFARLLPLSYAMAMVILVFSVVLIVGDVVAPISIN